MSHHPRGLLGPGNGMRFSLMTPSHGSWCTWNGGIFRFITVSRPRPGPVSARMMI